MTFANPAALWLLALAVPVVVLHLLRPRRPPVEVSSVFLWQQAARPVSAAAPWQRLRPNLLLFLQLLAVALLALAAARPVRVTQAPLARHTVFIVDTSGSMASTDGRPDRLGEAKARARDLRRQLPSGGVASLVVASAQARVVLSASPDPDAFNAALAPVRTTAGAADFPAAFSLAESLETPGAPVRFVFLSDGRLRPDDVRLLPPGTRYFKVGQRATNRAIRRLVVEPRGSGQHARITLRNTGGPAAEQTLRLDVDGRSASRVPVALAPGATLDKELELPGGDRVEAFLEGEDLLAADNRAFAVAGRRRPLKVLLAGPDDLFLQRLLAASPGVSVERSATSRPAPGFDLAIYSGVPVPADPGAPVLAVAPPGGLPGLRVTGEVTTPAVTLVRADHPLLRGIDLSEVAIAKAQRLEAPADETLVGAETTPLLVTGTRGGRPFVYLAFSLPESNLGVQVAFPLLGDRLLTELAGAVVPPSDLVAGSPLPVGAGRAVSVSAPGGVRFDVPAEGPAPVADRPGFWRIHEAGRPDRVLAVNADPEESALAPADGLPVRSRSLRPGERSPSGEMSLLRWFVLALLALLAIELVVSRRAVAVSRRQWRLAMVTRGLIAVLLLGALVGLSVPRTARRMAVMFLVDASDSVGSAGRASAVEWVRDALGRQPDGAVAGVALFGGDARLELTLQHRARLHQPAVKIDSTRTNLASALRLAGALLPADARRRVVLLSDGRATEGDAAAEAARLRADGVRVDIYSIARAVGPDVAVARLDVPRLVRRGETFSLRATIAATESGPVRLSLSRDGTVVEERTVDVKPGETVVDLAQVAGDPGVLRYRLDAASADDSVPENDVGHAAVPVEGPPTVLVVEGMPGEADVLAAALRSGGLPVDVVGAAALPPVDRLATYAATVMVDVDARTLAPEQVGALGAATRDLGKGLVVIGGDRSYALGGYLDSELERLLPVTSDVKDPKRRSSVAEVLAIDSSGSMAACHCREGSNGLGGGNFAGGAGAGGDGAGGVNKTAISRAAAARAIRALDANDQVGVLAFNTEQRWVVPLQKLPAEDVVTKGLRGLHPAGGTDLRDALPKAAESLRAAKAKLKHIILFTDGFTSQDGLAAVVEQAGALAREGITVSVLATGEGASEPLRQVAEAGRGRFYPGRDLAEVPELMAQEAVVATRNFVNEGEFFPKVVSTAAPVRELKESPALLGYVATTAKGTASTLLRIGDDDDPLLASWRLGLGRATAWTSDASDRWSPRWAGWPGYVGFWTGVVKDTFPLAGSVSGSVRAELAGDRLRVTVESAEPWPDASSAEGRVAGPDLAERPLTLERTSATTFVGETAASAPGTYGVGAVVNGPGGPVLTASALATQSFSAEYRPEVADPGALARLSHITRGRGAIRPNQVWDPAGLPTGRGRVPLAGWLLLAAALLWPVDVALRRLALHGSAASSLRTGMGGAGAALGRIRRRVLRSRPPVPGQPVPSPWERPPHTAPPAEEPSERPPAPPPTLDRLLQRKRAGRTERKSED